MDNFTFYSPTFFAFGKDSECRAGELVRRFGGSKVLLHYGGSSAKKSGLLDRIKESLAKEGIDCVELGGVKPNPRSGLVYEGIDIVRKQGVDFILAAGGGSSIDSAKAIAAGALYDGDFWDLYSGTPITMALPVGTVLTIAAAGSEGSGDSVITKEEGMYKRGTGSDLIRPKFSILNPALTQTLPPYQTACGITDIMAHLLERYLTNTKDVVTTDRMIEGLLLAMIEESPKVIADPDDYEARANIMWAGMMAHNNSCGVGRSQDWISHDIEHELSALYDCAHGAGLAVTFPAYLSYVYEHDTSRLVQWATRVWGVEDDPEDPKAVIFEGIARYRAFLRSIGMPQTLAELGGSEQDIDKLAHTACYGNGRDGKLRGFVELNEDDIKQIYRLMI
ncbi:MAG: iron-containing alcohol dehydrogenase [Clostridiales bacterium]|jgi:alcohol dehydrogenase YqhD (iron-dependent ADH family)|nr:iron-containing alcohol dehydrogenase [Clostridiales bacterium]